ncbi:hypothetical protein [Longimicrobium sp.]|uniref:hypothetical protein n=1 Tax=Longimicrobium sp. TaxID=2029185 RepID=UPI002BAA881E|nr:hypothetical protein [Longimicrobium sp.]HSU14681.1 hypothetical protein [Longimicrobium sp.]
MSDPIRGRDDDELSVEELESAAGGVEGNNTNCVSGCGNTNCVTGCGPLPV